MSILFFILTYIVGGIFVYAGMVAMFTRGLFVIAVGCDGDDTTVDVMFFCAYARCVIVYLQCVLVDVCAIYVCVRTQYNK